MVNENNSTTNWEPLQGSSVAAFGANNSAPDIPESFPVDAANILIENGVNVQLVDEENQIININGEINKDMIPDLITSFYGDEYWQEVKNQNNLGNILIGALGFFEIEGAVEQEGVLRIRGRANVETLEDLNI